MGKLSKAIGTTFKVERVHHAARIDKTIKCIELLLREFNKEVNNRKKVLERFTLLSQTYDSRFQTCHLRFEATIPYLTDHSVEISFFLLLQENKNSVRETKTTSCKVRFEVSPYFDSTILKRMMYARLAQWVKGAKSEKLFYQEFLVNLPQKYLRISSVYPSGKQADIVKGVDFVICFYSMLFWEPVKICVNLKSSDMFIEKHKEKYPTISTFIFKPWQLQDMKALERRFLHFLVRAQYAPQHY